MKKFFLFSLMTVLCTVMAFAGNVAKIGNTEYATLQAAFDAASAGQTVELIDNVTLTNFVNIDKSLTFDGHGYKISGYGTGNLGSDDKNIVLAINYDACIKTSATGKTAEEQNAAALKTIEVTIQDIEILCTSSDRTYGIVAYDGVASLAMNNVKVLNNSKGNFIPVCITGDKTTPIDWTMENSTIKSSDGTYPAYLLKPINATLKNSTIEGFCGLYFKYQHSVYGATCGTRGSIFNIDACTFNCANHTNGESNNFAVFPIEDDGITLNLNNCTFNASTLGKNGDAWQRFVNLQYWKRGAITAEDVKVTVTGDNTHLYGVTVNKVIFNAWSMGQNSPVTGEGTGVARPTVEASNFIVEFKGGTFSFNPKSVKWALTSDEIPSQNNFNGGSGRITIDDDVYEVKEVNQGGTTVYRVVKKVEKDGSGDPLYNLNSDVPTDEPGAGNNPASSFELSDGSDMTLNQQVTKAGYVQVMDDATEGATTVTVGKDSGEDKDQKLIINNGLDVQGDSKVEVKAGSTLEIGEGGITTEKPENIVIGADENGAASLIMDPTINVNQTPKLTVKMTAKQIGRDAAGDYYWHRYAMPVESIDGWTKEGILDPAVANNYPTYVYGWDYAANDWVSIYPYEMEALQGYTLTLASEEIEGSAADGHLNVRQDVTYTFKGNLVGNTNQPLNFQHEGFNFFGNSYTGYMDVKTALQGLEDNHIDGTAYMWKADEQIYVGISLYKLIKGGLDPWQTEVAPMQTFILRLRGADSADEEINYASAIWGNPRYNHPTPNAAPRRRVAAISEDSSLEIVVKAANGKSSSVDFTETANNSDAFESGYDVEKYMNEKTINLYATVEGVNLSSVVTNNIAGKTLSLKTNDEITYTLSFKNVESNAYAVRDNATNKVIAIEEGASYEFAAQPNSTVEGRFEIVDRANVVTSIDNAQDNKANVKGIYTIMGQYVGENFDVLPTGVYVVDGVKIVK